MKFNLSKNKKQNLVYSLKSNDETLIGLYIGIWCGDGTQYYDKGYRIKICCHDQDKELIEFYKFVLERLFGKSITHTNKGIGHQAYLRFNSKFIYNFVSNYVSYTKNKTYSICLKNYFKKYSKNFLEGFILGLALTDGYLKERFYLNVISKKLAKNLSDALLFVGLKPKHYVSRRKKYGWKDLYTVRLNKEDSKKLISILNSLLRRVKHDLDFRSLKYGLNFKKDL